MPVVPAALVGPVGWLASAAVAQKEASEVQGLVYYRYATLRHGLATAYISRDFWFKATSDGKHWFIRVEPVTNQVNTFDYAEAGFDGTNLCLVRSIRSWMENEKALGRPVGPNPAVGYITKRPVPGFEWNHQLGPLWLAYGSAGYFRDFAGETMHCPAFKGVKALRGISATEDYQVRVRVVPGPGGVPSTVTFLETNAPGSPYFQPPPGVWWTNALFAVQQFTNIGPFTVPLLACCKAYAPYLPPGKAEPEMLEMYAYDIQAASVRLVPAPASWRPELRELTHIGDLRFMHDEDQPIPAFFYFGQGKWYTEAEAKRLPEYRKAAGLAPSRVSATAAVRLLLLVVLLSGPAVYLVLRKRQTEEGQ